MVHCEEPSAKYDIAMTCCYCNYRDQLFPALGFGARLPPNGIVSHEFALVSKHQQHKKRVP